MMSERLFRNARKTDRLRALLGFRETRAKRIACAPFWASGKHAQNGSRARPLRYCGRISWISKWNRFGGRCAVESGDIRAQVS